MPVLHDAARTRLQRHIHRHRADLLSGSFAGHGFPLHPPTARAAAADLDGTLAFIRDWEGVPGVVWEERNWSAIGRGRQRVPVRLQVDSIEDLVGQAGLSDQWRGWVQRRDLLTGAGCTPEALGSAVASWADAELADLTLALDVVAWFRAHPGVGVMPREVAVEGVHTKWLEQHRPLVETLVAASRGVVGRAELGLVTPPVRVRLRFHPGEGPGGLGDVEIPLTEVDTLPVPRVFVMVENLTTFLALPTWPGAVLAWGAGFQAAKVSADPWFRQALVLYWGDLDADGFGILSDVRLAHGSVRSVLMDADTVRRWAPYGVPDRDFRPRHYPGLQEGELAALEGLIVAGHLRIEQERIRFDVAVEALGREIAAVQEGN